MNQKSQSLQEGPEARKRKARIPLDYLLTYFAMAVFSILLLASVALALRSNEGALLALKIISVPAATALLLVYRWKFRVPPKRK